MNGCFMDLRYVLLQKSCIGALTPLVGLFLEQESDCVKLGQRVGPHFNISVSLQERDSVTIKQSARAPGLIGQDRVRGRFLQ